MSNRPGRGARPNSLRALDGGAALLDPTGAMAQQRMMEMQQQAAQHNQTMQSQHLVTQQSTVALDAAKFIVGNHEHFTDEDAEHAKDIVRNIAMFYAPRAVIPDAEAVPEEEPAATE